MDEVKKDSEEFHGLLAEESGIDSEEEELFGVENMIKVADLERELKEKEKIIEEKEKEIKKLKEQLKKK